jgi:hypothetical protein
MARQRRSAPKKRGSRRGRPQPAKRQKPVAPYYIQPGKRGSVVVLHRPVGNRASPKVCGVMPSQDHAKALMEQLLRAERALLDLFYEATDDGIEALEAVLTATRSAVLERMPADAAGLSAEEMEAERDRIQRELDSIAPQSALAGRTRISRKLADRG